MLKILAIFTVLTSTLLITPLSLSADGTLMVGFAGNGVENFEIAIGIDCDSNAENCKPDQVEKFLGGLAPGQSSYTLYSGNLTNNHDGSKAIYTRQEQKEIMRSSYAPALARFGSNNILYAAWIENNPTRDKNNFFKDKNNGKLRTAYSTSNGLHWEGFRQVNGNTGFGSPAMVAFKGKLYIAFKGRHSDKLYITRSSDGINWETTRRIGKHESSNGPSLEVHNGKLWVSYRGIKSKKLYYGTSSDGINWTGGGKLKYKSSNTPYLASHNGKIYMAYKGSSSNDIYIVYSSNNGASWSREYKLPSTIKSDRGPAISSNNGKLYLAFKGLSSNKVLYASSYNGINWDSVKSKPGSRTSGSLHLTK